MKSYTVTFLFLALLASAVTVCFADDTATCIPGQSKTVDVRAEIPPLNALTVTVTRFTDNGQATLNANSVDFGTLSYDQKMNIFKANCYYAVDAAVTTNAPAFTLTHTLQESVRLVNGKETLDRNINVTFFKWFRILPTGTDVATMPNPTVQLGRFSLADSTGKSFNSSVLTGKALRIIYQVATGTNDAPGVVPITNEKPVGQYKGQIKITLVQS